MAISAEELKNKLVDIVSVIIDDIQRGKPPPLNSTFQKVSGLSIALFDSQKIIKDVIPHEIERFDPVFFGPDFYPFKKALIQFAAHKILGDAYPEVSAARVYLESTPGSPWFTPRQNSSTFALIDFENSEIGKRMIILAKEIISKYAFSSATISESAANVYHLMKAVQANDPSFSRLCAVVILSQLAKNEPRATLWLKGRIESAMQSTEPFGSANAAHFYIEDLLESFTEGVKSTPADVHNAMISHGQYPAVRSLLNSVNWDLAELRKTLKGEGSDSHKWLDVIKAAKQNDKLNIDSFDCLRKIIVLRHFPATEEEQQTQFLAFIQTRINKLAKQ